MRGMALCAAMLAGLMATGGSALAVCQGTPCFYQDTFDKLQPTWGEPRDALNVANGQLVVTPASARCSGPPIPPISMTTSTCASA